MESDVLEKMMFVDLASPIDPSATDTGTETTTTNLHQVSDELNDAIRLNQNIFSLQDDGVHGVDEEDSSSAPHQGLDHEVPYDIKITRVASLGKAAEKENQPKRKHDQVANDLQGNQNGDLVDMKTAVFQCQFCDESHGIKDLHAHLRKIHRARIQYMCNLCESIFTHTKELKQHLELHQSGIDPSTVPPPRKKERRKKSTESRTTTTPTTTRRRSGRKQKKSHKKSKKSTTDDERQDGSPSSTSNHFIPHQSSESSSSSSEVTTTKVTKGSSDQKSIMQQQPPQPELNNDDDWLASFNEPPSPLETNDDWGWDTDLFPAESSGVATAGVDGGPSKIIDTSTTTIVNKSSVKLDPEHVISSGSIKEERKTNLSLQGFVNDLMNSSNNAGIDVLIPCPRSGCGQVFKSGALLEAHEAVHTVRVQVDFMCDRCREYFKTVEAYREHNETRNRCQRSTKRAICKRCGHASRNNAELVIHMQVHTGVKLFRCTEEGCGKDFTTNKSLARHIRLIHVDPEEKSFNCKICGKSYASSIDLKNHARYHELTKRFNCSVCSKSFALRSHLAVHERRHTGEKPFSCPIANCGRTFATNPEVRRHVSTHDNARKAQSHSLSHPEHDTVKNRRRLVEDGTVKYTCEDCGKGFAVRDNYCKHRKIHDPKRQQFFCEVCGKTFWNNYSLRVHRTMHEDGSQKNIECETCGKKFASQSSLALHARGHVYTQTRTRVICEICGKTFSSKTGLKVHMERHRGESNYVCDQCGKGCKTQGDLRFHKYTHAEVPPFKCEFCEYRCTHPSNLNHHVDLEHLQVNDDGDYEFVESKSEEREKKKGRPVESKEKNFICDVCSTAWSTERNLQYHQLYHKAERPSICRKCKQRFVSKYELWIHQKQHRAPKPEAVTCLICNKYCTSKPGLDCHMRYNHTGESPYKCTFPDCPRSFKSRPDLKYHIVTHTGQYPFSCQVCGKKAITRGNLNAHMKTHDKNFAKKLALRTLIHCPDDGCSVTFRSKKTCTIHIRSHHPDHPEYLTNLNYENTEKDGENKRTNDNDDDTSDSETYENQQPNALNSQVNDGSIDKVSKLETTSQENTEQQQQQGQWVPNNWNFGIP